MNLCLESMLNWDKDREREREENNRLKDWIRKFWQKTKEATIATKQSITK
jgi:hypothetical protein